MSEGGGLIAAILLDGNGGGGELDWQGIEAWTPEQGLLWLHLDREGLDTQSWLQERSGIDPVVAEALLTAESRPRLLRLGDALLVILRGVNLNPGADPEDMVGVSCWVGEGRIVTIRRRRLMAANDIREALRRGEGPKRAGEFLVDLLSGLIERMGTVIADIDDRVDELEESMVTGQSAELRSRLAGLRRMTISLRRYLAPQREVMSRLQLESVEWLTARDRGFVREIADRTMRYVEELDEARERAQVTQDELSNRLAEQMNRTMYVLAVVAAVLLPPSLLTGLLGINVGGMPGIDSGWAFTIVVGLIVAIGIVEVALLRRLKWI